MEKITSPRMRSCLFMTRRATDARRAVKRLAGMLPGLRKPKELIVTVVTLLACGCPIQAIVHAYGLDECTVASWPTGIIELHGVVLIGLPGLQCKVKVSIRSCIYQRTVRQNKYRPTTIGSPGNWWFPIKARSGIREVDTTLIFALLPPWSQPTVLDAIALACKRRSGRRVQRNKRRPTLRGRCGRLGQ